MIGVFSFLAGFWTFLSERVRINNISDRFMNGIIDSDKCDRGFIDPLSSDYLPNIARVPVEPRKELDHYNDDRQIFTGPPTS